MNKYIFIFFVFLFFPIATHAQSFEIQPKSNPYSASFINNGQVFTQTILCSDLPIGTLDQIDINISNGGSGDETPEFYITLDGSVQSQTIELNGTGLHDDLDWYEFFFTGYDLSICSGSLTVSIGVTNVNGQDSGLIKPAEDENAYLNGSSEGDSPSWLGDIAMRVYVTEPALEPELIPFPMPVFTEYRISSTTCDFNTSTSTCQFFYDTSTSTIEDTRIHLFDGFLFMLGIYLLFMGIQTWFIIIRTK